MTLISDKLAKLNSNSLQAFVFPAKKGSPCLAKFDGGLYRAQLESQDKNGKCLVFFVDFGNTSEVRTDEVKKMPDDLLGFPN